MTMTSVGPQVRLLKWSGIFFFVNLCGSRHSLVGSVLVYKAGVSIPGQASKLNMKKKIFLRRVALSRFRTKILRVNRNLP